MTPRHAAVAVALLAPALLLNPAVAAANPVPEPEPIPVGPVEPAVTTPQSAAGGQIHISAPQVGGTQTFSTNSYLDPAYTVPNLNGDPCTGAWESTACYAMHFDSPPAVQPRSTVSASP